MERSEQITEIAAAMAGFSADVTNPPQTKIAQVTTKNGGSYSYSYADLGDILTHIRPALSRHGLAITQELEVQPDKVEVTTLVLHKSGEYMAFRPLALPAPEQATPQGYGGVITYARRYALMAALGLAADADDDAIAASGHQAPPARRETATRGGGRKATDKQLGKLHAVAKKHGITEDQLHRGVKRDYRVESLRDLTTKQASDLIDRLSSLPATAEVPDDIGADEEQARIDQADEDEAPGMDAEEFRRAAAEAGLIEEDEEEVQF